MVIGHEFQSIFIHLFTQWIWFYKLICWQMFGLVRLQIHLDHIIISCYWTRFINIHTIIRKVCFCLFWSFFSLSLSLFSVIPYCQFLSLLLFFTQLIIYAATHENCKSQEISYPSACQDKLAYTTTMFSSALVQQSIIISSSTTKN
jgi:hypothetical protein